VPPQSVALPPHRIIPEHPYESLQVPDVVLPPELQLPHPQHPQVPGKPTAAAVKVGNIDSVHAETGPSHRDRGSAPEKLPEVLQRLRRYRITRREDVGQGIGPGQCSDEFGRGRHALSGLRGRGERILLGI
jgi:hypothetical protein